MNIEEGERVKLLKDMFGVRFSDKVEFNFTETQIKLIPYFKTMLESDFKADFHINHASAGFEFLHTYATLDEIDIPDPHDKYLFVLKQCDFFCYDKLKELVESKYGFRTDVSEIKDNIGKHIKCNLTYLGSMGLHVVNVSPEGACGEDYGIHVEKIFEPPTYSSDNDINRIFVERYKNNMDNYYLKLFSDMFHPYKAINTTIRRYGRVDNYTFLTWSDYKSDRNRLGGTIHSYLHLINPKYIIRIINNIIQTKKENRYFEEKRNRHIVYQIYTSDVF